MTSNEVVTAALAAIRNGDLRDIPWSDPRVAAFADDLRKAQPRHDLCEKHNVLVEMNVAQRRISIFQGQTVGATPPAPAAAALKPQPPRDPTKHTFTPPAFMPSVMKMLKDPKPMNLWFWGPTQCGKSLCVLWIGQQLGRKVYRINCRDDMTSEVFLGEQLLGYEQGTTGNVASVIKFVEGFAVKAMQEGLDKDGNEVGEPGILYIDEVGAAPPHIAIALNRLLETDNPRRSVILDSDGGREVQSHSGFRVICAANTQGRGATTQAEAGYTAQLRAQDASLLARMTAFFRFGYNREAERVILQEKLGSDRLVEAVLKFRDALRDDLKQGKLQTPFTTHHIIAIGDLYRALGSIGEAVYRAVFDGVLADELPRYNELAVLHFREDLLMKYGKGSDMDYL